MTEATAKRLTGGSAAERGLDFQARVCAVVMAHLLAERPLGWLEGAMDDTPLELAAETGGPGDDIRFLVKDGKQVESQAKRGLQRGADLWDSLMALSKGISDGSIDAGVLAVCPNSSGTIRESLAEDIVRLGTGRTDGLREIGRAWAAQLEAASLDTGLVCRRLRIVVISAVDGNRESEATAVERLGRIVQDQAAAWHVLVEYGRRLIRRRERSARENIHRALSLSKIAFNKSTAETRVQLAEATRQWLHRTHATITVIGVRGEVPFDGCWLELRARAMDEASNEQEDLDKALRRYHEYDRRSGSGPTFHSQTIGRFVPKCVVVGGPGMGKSTLLKKLALDYSADGFLTLLVRLPQVAALLTRDGRRLEDSLMEVALSGSGLRTPVVSLDGAVILCDALDECGSQQPLVTASLHAFSMAHPRARVVLTSRPIGYRPGELVGWQHYELQPLSDKDAEKAVAKVLEAIPFPDTAARSRAVEQAIAQLSANNTKGAASRSPLMITLVAALSAKGIDAGQGKSALYRRLFQLLEEHPPTRLNERLPSEPERQRFLELLGWCLLAHGNETAEQALSRCARWWSEEMGLSFLASETKISECAGYWEGSGVIERVRTHTQEAITFVHKTFGEFAAARYMSRCDPGAQRQIVERAIATPDWKEALSFASHLGLNAVILQVWADLAESGDTKAGNRLDDAVELVVQAGAPLEGNALAGFIQCCWRTVEDTNSHVRYVAGGALSLASANHWSVAKEGAMQRLDSPESWARLVAWTCLCTSPEEVAVSVLTDVLPGLADSRPNDAYLGKFSLRPNGNDVWQKLVLGAARRILATPPDPRALQVLNETIDDAEQLSVDTVGELGMLFQEAGMELSGLLKEGWSQKTAWMTPDRERWNREAVYLLELIDDPLVPGDEVEGGDQDANLELGACMSAISLWEMSVGDNPSTTSTPSADATRRRVIHALVRSASLDHRKLVRQARTMKLKILGDVQNKRFGLFDLPKVDANAELDHPLFGEDFVSDLEDMVFGGSELFAVNAAHALYSMRAHAQYPGAVKRLLTRGQNDSLRISAALAKHVPDGAGQQLILDRLCLGDSTDGCRYLYQSLEGPFGPRHLEAIRKGLGGASGRAAEAAAELVKEFPLDGAFAKELRCYLEQWRVESDPDAEESPRLPVGPRGELAKILAPVFRQDHDFLLALLTDEHGAVQDAAREAVLAEAAESATLGLRLLEVAREQKLPSGFFRMAVSRGLYSGEQALVVASLLHSEDAGLRYAALPILDVKFLQPDRIREEANRLLKDTEMDIREGASRALRAIDALGANARNPSESLEARK
jgi:hypothetical protein